MKQMDKLGIDPLTLRLVYNLLYHSQTQQAMNLLENN